MAAIPTFVILGDYMLNGPEPVGSLALFASPSSGELWTTYFGSGELMRCVPWDAASALSGGRPASPAYLPWWDGWTNTWCVYHHQGDVVPGQAGANWYTASSATNAQGWGFDVVLMQELAKRYTSAPYFKVFKQAVGGGGGIGGAPLVSEFLIGNAARTSIDAEWSTAVAAAGPDTLDVQAVFLVLGSADIYAGNASYETHLRALITELRTKWGADLPIILTTHARELWDTVGAGVAAPFLRYVHEKIILDSTVGHVGQVDCEGARFCAQRGTLSNQATISDVLAANTINNAANYDAEEHIRWGTAFLAAYDAIEADVAANIGTAIRAYIYIGTSQTVGGINYLYARHGEQETLVGPSGGLVSPQALIWDGTQLSPYSVETNANTLGTTAIGQFGSELTLFSDQVVEHPTETIAVLKIGKNASCLTTETGVILGSTDYVWEKQAGTLYQDMLDEFAAMKVYAVNTYGKNVDLHGVLVNIGDNDGPTEVAAQAFATKLPTFITNLQTDLPTRVGGKALPIIFVRTHEDSGNPINATALATIRTAIDTADATDQVGVIDIDDQELRRTETPKVHYGGELTYYIGRAASQLFEELSVNLTEGGTEESTDEVYSPSAAATFTVEDGSGLSTANSYVSVSDADAYHLAHGNPTAWTGATTTVKQDALRRASQWLDTYYGLRWVGLRKTSDQALDWPRSYGYDSNGYSIDDDEVPTKLEQATAEVALRYVDDPTALAADVEADELGILSESISVGQIQESITYAGGRVTEKKMVLASRILERSGLVETGSWARR